MQTFDPQLAQLNLEMKNQFREIKLEKARQALEAGSDSPDTAWNFARPLPEGADPKVIALLRAITDVHVTNEFTHFSDVKRGVLDEVFLTATKWATKSKTHSEYIEGLKLLYYYARMGKRVIVETNTATYDFKCAYDVLRALKGVIGDKSGAMVGEVGMYPLQSFSTRFKNDVVYSVLNTHVPGLMKLIRKNKLKLYVTEDFNIAVESRFWECEDLTDLLKDLRGFDRYKLTPNLTMYVLDQE